jgi:uncharacterized protein (DUF2132 family)
MTDSGKGDPLHGITLKMIVTELQKTYGWQELGHRINIKCFTSDPSIASSLKFLRKTPWARNKVEKLYLETRHTNINRDIWACDTMKNTRKRP